MKLKIYSHKFEFPSTQEPEWSSLVERWYQLDAAAFGVTEVYWQHRAKLHTPPAWMLLCSPGASNLTDAQFALAPQPSPAKFVHTLPNIRSAALLQVMKWSGSVLCLQNDPNTILTGLFEGLSMAKECAGPVWIVSVSLEGPEPRAYIFVLDEVGDLKIQHSAAGPMANPNGHDKQLLSWILQPKSQPFLGNGLWIE